MKKVSSKPNILLLLIDSLRADRLYQTKLKTAKTPNMDSLIKNGICFSQAISSSDGTVFSMATVLTGSYPYKTKVASNRLHKIHSKVKTYVTLLRESGYNTYSITYDTTGVHRFAQDFEHKTPYSIGSNLYNGFGNRIIKFIDSLKDPWLLYIHLEDLHAPFKAPSEFDNDKYGVNQYDRIISGIDSWLGRVLEKINHNNTLIVITSDHGDYIPTIYRENNVINFERGLIDDIQTKIGKKIPPLIRNKLIKIRDKAKRKSILSKAKNLHLTRYEERDLTLMRANPGDQSYLYDDMVHVPLILSGKTINSPKVVSQQVGLIDIFPTLVDIIGIPNIPQVHGRSLLPLIKGDVMDEKPVYLESTAKMKKSHGDVIGIRTSNFKYFRNTDNPNENVNLYDLQNDPFEEHNIAISRQEVIKTMEQTLTELKKDSVNEEKQEEMSEEEIKKIENELRKLGYM